MVWKRLFGRNKVEHGLAGRRRRSLMPVASSVAGLPPPIRPCKAVSTPCASAGTWPPTIWSGQRGTAAGEPLARAHGVARSLAGDDRGRLARARCDAPLPPDFRCPRHRSPTSRSRLEEPVSVAFTIGPERFRWEEEIDWDQRGGPVVRGQMRQRSGNAAALVPPEVPQERREELERHLAESATVFALDLRDRALDGEPLPERPTLADLARPCPECGDWLDWRGHCDACATRAYRRQTLRAEAARLAQERDDEEEDRYKWSERFPVARKRLADLDAEIAKLEWP